MPGGGAMSDTVREWVRYCLVVLSAGVIGSALAYFVMRPKPIPQTATVSAPESIKQPAAAPHFEEVRKDAPTLKDLRDGQCSGVWKLERLSDGKVYVWSKYAIETEPSMWLGIRVCREGSAYVAVPLNAHALIVEQDIAPSKDYIPVTLNGEVR